MNNFIESVASRLQNSGYLIETNVHLPGVQALLYARSLKPFRLGFAKVDDHFIFVDWENALFSRLDLLVALYKKFRSAINQSYHIPRCLRMRIPNLVVAAVSSSEYPPEAIAYINNTKFNPWIGGETGQIMLINTAKNELFYYKIRRFRENGSLPLSHAIDDLKEICRHSFNERND